MEDTSKQEILGAINEFSNRVDEKFEAVEKRFEGIDKRFEKVENKITEMESKMVTKDYLDEKLADLRGDLVVLTRKEDKKLGKLIEILSNKQVISEQDKQELLAMEPFAQ